MICISIIFVYLQLFHTIYHYYWFVFEDVDAKMIDKESNSKIKAEYKVGDDRVYRRLLHDTALYIVAYNHGT